MSWLSEEKMSRLIKRNADKFTQDAFQGFYSIDTLPESIARYPFFMIVNTQARNLEGEHWLIVFIDKERRGEIFDSFALPLANILIRWINRFSRSFSNNKLMYQHPLTGTCGSFVLYFLMNRLSDSKCISHKFTSSLVENEKRIMSFYHSLK